MIECLVFDYQDSFTYNIVSELKKLDFNVLVIPFNDIQSTYQSLRNSKQKKILIHGPGPGHPDDYRAFFADLEELLLKPNFFHVGICLGHQIMMAISGGVIQKSHFPMHGRKVNLTIPEWPIFSHKDWGRELHVQRYNSLSLSKTNLVGLDRSSDFKYVVQDDDVLLTYCGNQLTYQFHPESVGTTCPNVFFEGLKGFIYN